jgi:hypothetical protein
LLKDPDPWTRALAVTSLAALGEEERKKSLPDLLVMMATPNPGDPRGMAQRAAAEAMFARRGGIMTGSLDGVDRDLLYPALKSVLQNQDGRARGELAPIYGKLTDHDIAMLLPDIVQSVQKMAPSGEMFADGIRLAGLDLLSRLGIREGIPLCITVMEVDRWGGGRRIPKCLEYLARYGSHAKEVLPELKNIRATFKKPDENSALLDKIIADIESGAPAPAIIGLEDFRKKHAEAP